MTDVSFIPTFHHVPWVDNRDRVQAGGPNGFNLRFSTLETDLQTIGAVFDEVNTALAALGATPPPQPTVLTLVPALVAIDPPGWSIDSTGNAFRPAAQLNVTGLMAVALPDGVQLTTFRTLGVNSGAGILRISLFRSPLAGGTPDRMARVAGDANPFDNSSAVDPTMARVDQTTYRYFIEAALANAAQPDVVTISAFQIGYLAS